MVSRKHVTFNLSGGRPRVGGGEFRRIYRALVLGGKRGRASIRFGGGGVLM